MTRLIEYAARFPEAFKAGAMECKRARGWLKNRQPNPYPEGTDEHDAWCAGWNDYWEPEWATEES